MHEDAAETYPAHVLERKILHGDVSQWIEAEPHHEPRWKPLVSKAERPVVGAPHGLIRRQEAVCAFGAQITARNSPKTRLE